MMLNGIKILIGDDSILARKQLKDIVSTYGTPVFLEASNGQDAIDLYKKESPELVFLDIVMPVKDGIAAITEIKAYDKDVYKRQGNMVHTHVPLPRLPFLPATLYSDPSCILPFYI